jgi:DNA ligase (NAD+)
MKFDRIRTVYDKVVADKMSVEDLRDFKPLFREFHDFITDKKNIEKDGKFYTDVIEKYLKLCNDYYVFSSDGDVLITDRQYDEVTSVFKILGGESQVIYTDDLKITRWNERKHLSPNMVGSIEKCYSINDIYDWIAENESLYSDAVFLYIMLTPKYDGCSVVCTFDEDHNLVAALTRKDGQYGQDLTPLVKEAEKHGRLDDIKKHLKERKGEALDIKCEILVGTTEFDELHKERAYKNRRAASSAISANPSNIKFAKYLTFMPLVEWDGFTKNILCPISWKINRGISRKEFEYSILEFTGMIKSEGEYRKDGVIVTLVGIGDLSKDIMSDSLAYKFNTQVNDTVIESCYLSIGRTGKATPMIKVAPCEVNETEVTDVSLSNFKKCNKLDLHIGDTITIESAGDVIPMVKEVIHRDKTKPNLTFDGKCPHCGRPLKVRHKMDQIKGTSSTDFDLYCINPDCNRVISGRLSNFLDKMGAKGISDGVMSSVVDNTSIREYWQLFDLEPGCLANVDGWGPQSESELLKELTRIKETPFPYSKFLGAIGIPMVSTEKCKELMKHVSFERLVFSALKHPEECRDMVMSVDGFGGILADNICNYIYDNYYEIDTTAGKMNLFQDEVKHSKGTVVMSGFRDASLVKDIEELGFSYSENVNKDTVAVISSTSSSGKAKKAIKKGLPLFADYETEELLSYLQNL